MKDRKELLREVRQKEYDRLNNLTFSELESECCSWFNEDIRIYDNASADAEQEHLLDDYMRYRYNETEAELLEKLINK